MREFLKLKITLKAGISYKKSTTDNFEKLKAEDKVEVVGDKIVITLANKIDIKTGTTIRFEERIIKDGESRENRAFEQYIKDAFPTVNEANIIEGEVLTKAGGNVKVKLVGENLSEAVKVKILINNKDKTSNSEITESANVNVEVVNNTEQIISFTLPENKTDKAETYSVMVSLDNGKTYSSAIGVNILENRAKRLVATVLPTDKITDKPILSFMSIQSYGTSGGGTEQPDVTHTYTPVGQESKKTWVTMFGANFNKALTKIKIVDENGVEWYPLQNEGTSDSMDNFIMVSADGTGIYGNGNTQMFELICPRNVTIPTNPNGDVTFKYLVAVDGENYDQEVFVRATVVNDKVGKKENMTADEISEVKVKHETEDGKLVFKGATVKGYKWSKLRSFNVRPIENNANFEALKYKIVRADGSVEEKEIGHIHEEKVRDIKEVTFIYKSNINLDELNKAITNANTAKGTDKYKYATEEIKALDTSLATLEEGNLEEIVNGSIHEWLLERVGLVELRLAYVLSSILKEDASHIDEIEKVAYEFGAKQACEPGVSVRFAYNYLDDKLINGMPCDRVIDLVSENAKRIVFEQYEDVHAQYLDVFECEHEAYYKVRFALIKGLLSKSGIEFRVLDSHKYELVCLEG